MQRDDAWILSEPACNRRTLHELQADRRERKPDCRLGNRGLNTENEAERADHGDEPRRDVSTEMEDGEQDQQEEERTDG